MTLPLTGAQYDIAAGDYQATVTELGAGLRRLSRGGRPLITSYDADEVPPAGAGQLLAPWPNRVDGGRYEFGGASHQLDISEPARSCAIHGLTRWAPWRVTAHDAASVVLALDLLGHGGGYPFCLQLLAGYALTETAGLEVTVTATNSGSRPAPFGTGSHPYLLAGPGTIETWELELPAASWLPTDDRGIPASPPAGVTGPYDFRSRRAIGATVLDTAFTGLATAADGRAKAVLSGPDAEVTLWAGPGYGWLQVFTGDTLGPDVRRRAVAIEPMTCPPNAFVTGTDLLAIAPGETITRQWGISAAG